MLRLTGVIAFYLALVGAAPAEWMGDFGEDPMTDKKWAAVAAPFGEIGVPQVLFKCWADGSLQLGIIVGP